MEDIFKYFFFPECDVRYNIIKGLVVQLVKNLPAMQETQVRPLDQEDPLEKGMATHSLQYSLLENTMDRGGWQVTVHRVAQSQTQLSNTFTFFNIITAFETLRSSYLHIYLVMV